MVLEDVIRKDNNFDICATFKVWLRLQHASLPLRHVFSAMCKCGLAMRFPCVDHAFKQLKEFVTATASQLDVWCNDTIKDHFQFSVSIDRKAQT